MLHKTENICCTKRKIYAAQNGKYMLHKTENIRCTKRKIYAAQNGKYTLHKTENICCKKRKICAAQKRIQITENGKWNTLPGFHSMQNIAIGKSLNAVFDYVLLDCTITFFLFNHLESHTDSMNGTVSPLLGGGSHILTRNIGTCHWRPCTPIKVTGVDRNSTKRKRFNLIALNWQYISCY